MARWTRSDLVPDVEDILAAVLRLPIEERAAVAAELLASLDGAGDASEDVEAAWSEEIRQRLVDVEAGVVAPIPWPEARRRILAAANGGREGPRDRASGRHRG